MALWMSWEVSPIASAGQEVEDIEGAVKALDVSVQRIQERAMSSAQAAALGKSARTIREQILSDGRAAVERGERWKAKVGDVTVLLIPRDADSLV